MTRGPVRAWTRVPRWFVAVVDQGLVAILNLALSVTVTQVAGVTTLGAYTLSYRAASSGQTLSITFTEDTAGGNVTLQAATVAGGAAPAPPAGGTPAPDFTVTSTSSSQSALQGASAGFILNVRRSMGSHPV